MSKMAESKSRIEDWKLPRGGSIIFQQFRSVTFILLAMSSACAFVIMVVYVNNALATALSYSGSIAEHVVEDLEEYDPVACVRGVMDACKERRGDLGPDDTDASRRKLADVAKDDNWQGIDHMLKEFAATFDADALLILAGIDEQRETMVYVAGGKDGWEEEPEVGTPTQYLDWIEKARANPEPFPSTYSFSIKDGMIGVNGAYLREDDLTSGCLFCITRDTSIVMNAFRATIACVPIALVMAAIMWFVLLRRIRDSIVMPLYSISDAAQGYVADRLAGKQDIRHFQRLSIKTGNETEGLANVLSKMEHDLSDLEYRGDADAGEAVR